MKFELSLKEILTNVKKENRKKYIDMKIQKLIQLQIFFPKDVFLLMLCYKESRTHII